MADEQPKDHHSSSTGMTRITEEEINAVDITQPLIRLADSSPMSKAQPEQMKTLIDHASNPVHLQQVTMAEIRATLVQRMEHDLEQEGKLSDSTLHWLMKLNQQLSEVHKNLHGTKATTLSMEAKLSHAQLASLIRQAESELRLDIVDVEPTKEEE